MDWRVHINAINGYSFSGTVVSFLVTVLWIVTCANAINLIDGVDGLAAGVGLFASITMLIAALLDHNFPMALAVVPLAGACWDSFVSTSPQQVFSWETAAA